MQNVKMRAIRPKGLWPNLRLKIFKIAVTVYNSFLTVYIISSLLWNKVWKISDSSRKKIYPSPRNGKKLKVGIVSEYYYPHMGGLTGDVHYAALEFARMGYEVKLITSNVAEPLNISRSEHGFDIIRMGRAVPAFANESLAKVTFGWGVGREVKEMILREKFDVIHIHCPLTPILPLLVQRYADCPIVGHIHVMLLSKPSWYDWFHKAIQSFIADFDGLVAVSKVSAKPFEDWFGHKFEVIPNGIPVDDLLNDCKPIERFNDGVINLFFIGRMEPRNGISTLIDAFRIIHRAEPKTRLILAGDGPLQKYFEAEVEAELKPHVHFVGRVHEEKAAFFKTTTINVVPTNRIASLGVALLEAMLSGRPTVASDLPAFRESYSIDHDVLVAHPDRADEFASQVLRFIRDPEMGRQFAQRAQEKMLDRFSWTRIIERVDDYTNRKLGFVSQRKAKVERKYRPSDEAHQSVAV